MVPTRGVRVHLGAQFVEEQRLDEDEAFGGEPGAEARPRDERAERFAVGVGRDQNIDAAARRQPLARPLEERGDVAALRAGMPGAVERRTRPNPS